MSLGAELKRRLDLDEQPLSKRLRLAENVLSSPFFPSVNREEVVLDWIFSKLGPSQTDEDLSNCLSSLNICLQKPINFKNFNTAFKSRVLQVLSSLIKTRQEFTIDDVKNHTENITVLEICLNFVENQTVNLHLQQCVRDYFAFLSLILENILENYEIYNQDNTEKISASITNSYETLAKRALADISNFTKNFGKKGILVESFIDCKTLDVILEFSNNPRFSYRTLNICQSILFPPSSLQNYRNYLAVLIKGTSVSSLIEEKGESLRTVVKVMDILLTYKQKDERDEQKIVNFIKLFTYCCKSSEVLILSYNIVLMHRFGIDQVCINVEGDIERLVVEPSKKKLFFLQNIKSLTDNSINLNVAFSTESKFSLIQLLQEATFNILSETCTDQKSLLLIKAVIELDPSIFEPIMPKILPDIIVQKKIKANKNDDDIDGLYVSVIIAVLNIQFRLSRGSDFILKLLPLLGSKIESIEPEQRKYTSKAKKLLEEGNDASKVSKKIILSEDMFPLEFCNRFGKLSSELMSWQNIELLKQLSQFLDEQCIAKFNANDLGPSSVLLTEVTCALLCSFLENSRMADQSLSQNVVLKFSQQLETFASDVLGKFGSALLEITGEERLLCSFLNTCHSYGQLKLLLCRYQPYYDSPIIGADPPGAGDKKTAKIEDLSTLHTFLSSGQWKGISKLLKKMASDKCADAMSRLILQKIATLELANSTNEATIVKKHVLENLGQFNVEISNNDFNTKILFSRLTDEENKIAAAKMVSKFMSEKNGDEDWDILKKECVSSNKELLSMIVSECVRYLWILFDKPKIVKKYKSIYETSSAIDNFNIKQFLIEDIKNVPEYVNDLSDCPIFKQSNSLVRVVKVLDLLDTIPIEYLKENTQMMTIFTIALIKLLVKKHYSEDLSIIFDEIDAKNDSIFLKIYELSYKCPNIFDLFCPEFIFENGILECMSTKNGRYNSHFIILKHIFERFISKEYVGRFESIVTYLKSIDLVSIGDSEEKLKNVRFQVASALYVSLVNLRKGNLPSEIKAPIAKALNDTRQIVIDVFSSIKWKELKKKTLKKRKSNVNGDSSMEIDTDDLNLSMKSGISTLPNDIRIAKMNVLEGFAHFVNSCGTRDEKEWKNLGNGLELFINTSLLTMKDPEITSNHCKGCHILINTALKNRKNFENSHIFENVDSLYRSIFDATITSVQIITERKGSVWREILNIAQENIKLILESSEHPLFTELITEHCFTDFKPENSDSKEQLSAISNQLTRMLWSCLLDANLKTPEKTEARSKLVKRICWSFFHWLRSLGVRSGSEEHLYKEQKAEDEDEGFVDGSSGKGDKMTKENLDKMAVYFEVMTEFVSTKKMPLSGSLMDIILQMPVTVTFDVDTCRCFGDARALHIFCDTFEKCTTLVNALLIHRSEMLQDRWPCFLQAYRKLVRILCTRSNVDKVTDKREIEKLLVLAISMEKLTQSMVKNEKHDLSRISSYLIADIVSGFHKSPVLPDVKFHVEKCIHWLLSLSDSHSVGFLMRNMPDAQRILFQRTHANYNRYYKYTGTS